MMKRLIHILVVIFFSQMINAQTVLLKETVPEDFSKTDEGYGPNRKYYSYPYMSYGVNADLYTHKNEMIMAIKPLSSPALNFGTKYLVNYSKFSALVFDLNVGFNQYKLKNNQSYTLIDTNAILKSAKFQTYSLGTSAALRINFKPKRGNFLGKYLDLGGYIDWLWGRQFRTRYEGSLANYDINAHRISSLAKYQWGLTAQYGGGFFSIFARYRMSDLLVQPDHIIGLPRATIGISIFMSEI